MCICAHPGTEGHMGDCAQVLPPNPWEGEAGLGQSPGSVPGWVVTSPSTLSSGALIWGGRLGWEPS